MTTHVTTFRRLYLTDTLQSFPSKIVGLFAKAKVEIIERGVSGIFPNCSFYRENESLEVYSRAMRGETTGETERTENRCFLETPRSL